MDYDKMVDEMLEPYPNFLSAPDLIDLGIFKTNQATHKARRNGYGPLWIEIPGRGFVYPKQGLSEFLKERLKKGQENINNSRPSRYIRSSSRYGT